MNLSKKLNKEQYVIPYLISAFPGCSDGDMRALSGWLARQGWKPQQIQCFIPTPGTVATAMYYSRLDMDGKLIYVAQTDAERLRQHHILLGNDSMGIAARNSQKEQRPFLHNNKQNHIKSKHHPDNPQSGQFKSTQGSKLSPAHWKQKNKAK